MTSTPTETRDLVAGMVYYKKEKLAISRGWVTANRWIIQTERYVRGNINGFATFREAAVAATNHGLIPSKYLKHLPAE